MLNTFDFSPTVVFPVEIMTRRTAVFGISGSGKSNSATVIIEGLLALKEQVVLLDPKGEGWGLQTSADGKSPGFNVIVFGQPHGNIPELREEHAERVADFVVDSGRSVVLSMLGFEDDAAQRRFVTRFARRLYRRKSQQQVKSRTLVVIEEAHLFVPEHAGGASAEMVGAIKQIARQGRTAGLGLMIVDQRPQEVAKSIISQCELLICHQLTHTLDRDALHDWIRAFDAAGQGETFLASLAGLLKGECWVWSPAWLELFVRTRARRRTTYDSGATPDGTAAIAAPTAKANVDLDAIRDAMAAVPEPADVTTNKELRALVKDLREKIDVLTAANQTPVLVVPPALVTMVERAQQQTDAVVQVVRALAEAAGFKVADAPAVTIKLTPATAEQPVAAAPTASTPTPRRSKRSKRRRRRARQQDKPRGKVRKLTPRQQRLLNAAVTLHHRDSVVTRRAICKLLGVKENSGSMDDALREMDHAGLLTRSFPSAGVMNMVLTPAGLQRGKMLDGSK